MHPDPLVGQDLRTPESGHFEPAAAVFDLAKAHQFLAANDKTNLTPMANNNKITVRRRSRPREPVDLPDSRACPDLQISNCAAHRKDKLARCLIQIV
jgi:hypothetical protein